MRRKDFTLIDRLNGTLSALFFAMSVSCAGVGIASAQEAAGETPFLTENAAAMDKMMADMAVSPTGNVDVDFSAMMIPHHEGAIDMALAELRYGKNEQLRRIAQEIVVEQQQEIIAMRLALGQPLPPPATAPTQVVVQTGAAANPSAHMHDHSAMSHGAMSMSSESK